MKQDNIYHQSIVTIILFALVSLIPQPALSQEANSFTTGIQHFKAGQYQKALQFFNKAASAGQISGPLYYNIGVSYYKIGQYKQADQAFAKAANYKKMAALATYNRGLTSLKTNDKSSAYTYFKKVSNQSTEPKLAKLAEIAIFKADLAPTKTQASAWMNFFSLAAGYDDNVKIISESDIAQASGFADSFSELSIFSRGPITKDSKFQAQFNLYYQKYFDLDEYDFASPGLGLFYVNNSGGWKLDTGIKYNYSFLDHNRYEQVGVASVKLTKKINKNTNFHLNYYFSYIDMLEPLYEYLDGYRNKIEAKGRWKINKWRISLVYALELNETDDKQYAPTRNFFSAAVRYNVTKKLSGKVRAAYRYSLYDFPKGNIDRTEDLYRGSAALTYRLPAFWYANLSYTYYDNDSNYDTYDYTRGISAVTLSKSF